MELNLNGTTWHNGKRLIQAFHNDLGFASNLYLEGVDWHNGKMLIEFAFNQSNPSERLYLTGTDWRNGSALIVAAYNTLANVIDNSAENWSVLDVDNYLLSLIAANYNRVNFIFKDGSDRSYISDSVIFSLYSNNNTISGLNDALTTTDKVLESLASYVTNNNIIDTDFNMNLYDACTVASEEDRAIIVTEENHNSIYNLEIV